MPEYDIGRAHGKVVIDTDTRGIKKGDQSLGSLEDTIAKLQKTVAELEKKINSYEKELKQATKASDEHAKASKRVSSSHKEVSKSSSSASRSLRTFNADMSEVIRMSVLAAKYTKIATDTFKNLKESINTLNAVQGITSLAKLTKEMVNWRTQARKFIMAGTVPLMRNYIQLGETVAHLTEKEKQYVKTGRQVILVTAAIATAHGFLLKNANKVVSVFERLASGNGVFARTSQRLLELGRRTDGVAGGFKRFYTDFISGANNMNIATKALIGGFLGLRIAQQGWMGLRKFFGLEATGKLQIAIVAILSALQLIPVAAELASKGIIALANTGKALVTLLGVVSALPGALATIVGAVAPVMVTFKRLGTLFEDVFKAETVEEMSEALQKLPEHLRPLGKRLGDVKKTFEEIGDAGVISFLGKDSIKEIDALEAALKGPITQGIQVANNTARAFRQELVGIATDGENITAMNKVWNNSAQFINNMKRALDPAIDSMRTLVTVGSDFFTDWSYGAEGAARKFSDFINNAASDGRLRKWMDDSFAGLRNLIKGTVDLGKAIGDVFDAFSTKNGADALAGYADSMERLANAAEKSKFDGTLKKWGDAVKNAGLDKFESYMRMLEKLRVPFTELYQAAKPFLDAISSAFEGTFVTMIQAATQALEIFLEAFSPFATIIGQELALIAGFKAITFALKPMANAARVVGGAFAFLSGAKALGALNNITSTLPFLRITDFLDKILPGTNRATGAVTKLQDAFGKLTSMTSLLGPLGVALTAIFIAFTGTDAANRKIRDFNKILDDGKKNLEEYKDALKQAFMDDGGIAGNNVFDTVTTQIADMRSNLEAQANELPDWWDNVIASTFASDKGAQGNLDPFAGVFAQGEQFNAMQKAAQDAEHAKKQFDELGYTSQELSQKVTGTQTAFDRFVGSLRASNDNEAADQIIKQREAFALLEADIKKAGTGNVALVNAIQQIGEAGEDTTSKLDGLRQALKALGLDNTTEIENAFAYSEAIRQLGEEAANLVDSSAGLDNLFGGQFGINTETGGANALNLFNALKDAVYQFQEVATDAPENAAAEWQRLSDSLRPLAENFTAAGASVDETEAKIREFVANNLGGAPKVMDILLQVDEGGFKANLAAVLLQAGKTGEISVPVKGDVTELQNFFNSIAPGMFHIGENVITFDGAAISDKLLADIAAKLQNPDGTIGVEILPEVVGAPGEAVQEAINPGDKPVQVPVQAIPSDGQRLPSVLPPAPAPKPAPTPPPAPPAAPMAARQQAPVAAPEVDTEALAASTKVAIDAFEAMRAAIVQKLGEAQNAVIAWTAGIRSTLQGVVSGASAQGSAFVDAFAAGLASNPAAIDAANKMAEDVKARFHQSPPKKGPLSAHGDAARYAGRQFVNAYAGGVDENGNAVASANRMAGGVASAGAQGPYELGKLLGAFNDIFGIGSKLVDIFSQISDTIFEAVQFMADPMGKGTIFGQKFYGRDPNISDRELQRRREDETQAAASSAMSGGGTSQRIGEGYSTDEALLANVPKGRYSQTGDADLTKGLADCSSAVEDLVAIMDGRATGGRSMSTQNAAERLAEWGFVQGEGGIGDMRVAFNANHMQATLPGGTNFNWGSDSAAALGGRTSMGADDPALTDRWYRPVDEELRKTLRENAIQTGEQVVHGLGAAPGPDLSELTDEQRQMVENGSVSLQTQEQMLQALQADNPQLNDAIAILQDEKATNEQVYKALPTLDAMIEQQKGTDTAQSRSNAQALESIRSDAMSERGVAEQNPIQQAAGIAGNVANVAKDVFASIDSVMQSIGAANELGEMFMRGLSNSEDVMKVIDNVQQFLSTAAQIASAVSSGLGVAAGIAAAGAADPSGGGAAASGALSGASQIASLVSAAFSTVNGIIDLGQEVYRIAGKYFGEFLGFLTGGGGGALMGDVKFLLDTVDGSLKTWSRDNPEDKRVFDNPFQRGGIKSDVPRIGEINVFGGPGQDPRDMTNEMMFAVSAASSGVWNYD